MVKETGRQNQVGLREQLIEAASKLFLEGGYENLSMRRVAQEVGCSQMAMYRHFANKQALAQHLCAVIYSDFTAKMNREMVVAERPSDRIRIFIEKLLEFAHTYPDHYTLIFLMRHSDPEVITERERLGSEFLREIRRIIRDALPPQTTPAVVDMRLRQILTTLHGTAALLIAHPKAYGLTKQKSAKDTEDTVSRILDVSLTN